MCLAIARLNDRESGNPNMKNNLFREKALKKSLSPEQINDYIKVSSPSVWVIFSAIAILLFGVFVWCFFGKIEMTVSSVTVCEDGKAYCYISENDIAKIHDGACAKIQGGEYKISNLSYLPELASDKISSYGLHLGGFDMGDWVYSAEV